MKQANVRGSFDRETRASIDDTIQSEERAFSKRLHEQSRNDVPLNDDISNIA